MDLNQDDICKILKFIDESKFNELHLEMGDLKLVVQKRDGTGRIEASEHTPVSDAKPVAFRNAVHETVEQKAASQTSAKTQEDMHITPPDRADVVEEGLIPIKSPMLGTFYTAPKPGDPPFVEVGSIVGVKDTVCIIEVMKLFTSITAGIRGSIAKICAENGQMVQYDEVLFFVKPEEESEN